MLHVDETSDLDFLLCASCFKGHFCLEFPTDWMHNMGTPLSSIVTAGGSLTDQKDLKDICE